MLEVIVKINFRIDEYVYFIFFINCGFELLIFTSFVAFKKKYFHSSFHAYFRLGCKLPIMLQY